jgi:hypothetical protein
MDCNNDNIDEVLQPYLFEPLADPNDANMEDSADANEVGDIDRLTDKD